MTVIDGSRTVAQRRTASEALPVKPHVAGGSPAVGGALSLPPKFPRRWRGQFRFPAGAPFALQLHRLQKANRQRKLFG